MILLEVVLPFCAASVVLALAPGPDNIFVLTQSAVHGRIAGLLVTLGLCTGLLFHTAAVALGLASLFQTSALAFNVVKAVGAAYLLYLAWKAFRAKPAALEAPGGAPSRGRLYGRGVVLNVTNPKVAVFFLAFLPQFASPDRGPLALQFLALGLAFIAVTLVVFCTIAWVAGALGSRLRRSDRAQAVMNRVAGTVFVGLAVKLAISQR